MTSKGLLNEWEENTTLHSLFQDPYAWIRQVTCKLRIDFSETKPLMLFSEIIPTLGELRVGNGSENPVRYCYTIIISSQYALYKWDRRFRVPKHCYRINAPSMSSFRPCRSGGVMGKSKVN